MMIQFAQGKTDVLQKSKQRRQQEAEGNDKKKPRTRFVTETHERKQKADQKQGCYANARNDSQAQSAVKQLFPTLQAHNI